MTLKEVTIQGEDGPKVHRISLCYNFNVARPLFHSMCPIVRSLISMVYSLGFEVCLDNVV